MTDRPPRVIPYTRQSLARIGETAQTSLSLDAQRAVISDWAQANGFVVADAIADHDLKGDDPDRPGLAELERVADPGDTVAVYKFDRLARDIVLQESLVRRLQAKNIQVISVTEPSTRLTRVIYGAVNEEFRDALSQRIRDAKRQQAYRGHYTGANTPYGYQRSQVRAIPLPTGGEYLRPTGVLTIEPTEAEIVREIYRRVAAGESLYAIVVDLNDRGVPTRHNRQWLRTTLKQTVQNRWYYGAATFHGEEVATGLHEPLVTRDEWERANLLLNRPKRRQKIHDTTSWLEGYVNHSCGQRMYLIHNQTVGKRIRTSQHFYCRSSHSQFKCGEPRRQISRIKLDAAVRECLAVDMAAVVSVADALDRAVLVAGGSETLQRRTVLEEKRARILGRYDRVREAWAAGLESIEWLAEEQAKRDTALANIDSELESLPTTPDPTRFESTGRNLHAIREFLSEMDEGALTSVLAELGTVIVGGSGVSIAYSGNLPYFIQVPHVAVVS